MPEPLFPSDPENAFEAFGTRDRFRRAVHLASGHINDTFRVDTDEGQYVLQRINHDVFGDIPGLMNNILIVTQHLEKKILSGSPEAGSFLPLRLIPARDGQAWLKDPGGNYWRLYNFIPGSRSYDSPGNSHLAYEAGRAYGRFQYLTSDIPAGKLVETIPFFHDLEKRLERFRDSVNHDPVSRVRETGKEISFAEAHAGAMLKILNLGRDGKIPLRVTHNDTKFNNVLFNEKDEAVCIVDLDTVMPGFALYDFGDAIRTGANTGAEDEADLSKVGIDMDLFKAYSRGYLEITRRFLTGTELENLAFSALVMTYIIGLRFLTDHLFGDIYFRIASPGHNLGRARAQFRLLESMTEHLPGMEQIIRGLT